MGVKMQRARVRARARARTSERASEREKERDIETEIQSEAVRVGARACTRTGKERARGWGERLQEGEIKCTRLGVQERAKESIVAGVACVWRRVLGGRRVSNMDAEYILFFAIFSASFLSFSAAACLNDPAPRCEREKRARARMHEGERGREKVRVRVFCERERASDRRRRERE